MIYLLRRLHIFGSETTRIILKTLEETGSNPISDLVSTYDTFVFYKNKKGGLSRVTRRNSEFVHERDFRVLEPEKNSGTADVLIEEDLDFVLIELLAYVADELSYYQDRVANEAYIKTDQARNSILNNSNFEHSLYRKEIHKVFDDTYLAGSCNWSERAPFKWSQGNYTAIVTGIHNGRPFRDAQSFKIGDANETQEDGLLGLIAEQFVELGKNIEEFYDDLFIDRSDDWVVPYITLVAVVVTIIIVAILLTRRGKTVSPKPNLQ